MHREKGPVGTRWEGSNQQASQGQGSEATNLSASRTVVKCTSAVYVPILRHSVTAVLAHLQSCNLTGHMNHSLPAHAGTANGQCHTRIHCRSLPASIVLFLHYYNATFLMQKQCPWHWTPQPTSRQVIDNWGCYIPQSKGTVLGSISSSYHYWHLRAKLLHRRNRCVSHAESPHSGVELRPFSYHTDRSHAAHEYSRMFLSQMLSSHLKTTYSLLSITVYTVTSLLVSTWQRSVHNTPLSN